MDLGKPLVCNRIKSRVIAGVRPVEVVGHGSYRPADEKTRLVYIVPGTTTTGRAKVEPTVLVDPNASDDIFLDGPTAFLPELLHLADTCCIRRKPRQMESASSSAS